MNTFNKNGKGKRLLKYLLERDLITGKKNIYKPYSSRKKMLINTFYLLCLSFFVFIPFIFSKFEFLPPELVKLYHFILLLWGISVPVIITGDVYKYYLYRRLYKERYNEIKLKCDISPSQKKIILIFKFFSIGILTVILWCLLYFYYKINKLSSLQFICINFIIDIFTILLFFHIFRSTYKMKMSDL